MKEQRQERKLTSIRDISKQQVLLTGSALLASGIVDVASHSGTAVYFGLAAVAGVGYLSKDILNWLVPGGDPETVVEQTAQIVDALSPEDEEDDPYKDQSPLAKLKRMVGIPTPPLASPKTQVAQEESVESDEDEGAQDEQLAGEMDFIHQSVGSNTVPGIPRYGVEQIIRHTVRNCFKAYIGRSLTQAGNPAVLISFYKRHIKLIGASQKGKSSMAAALLEIILATHDTDRVLVALLDMEDMTSKLFAGDPHIAQVRTDGKLIPLHARSREQVLAHLELILQIMEHRYTMSKTEIALQPLLIVYLEEFLALKNYFKQRARGAKGAQKEQAIYDYERLVFCITEIARLGLKVRVQFLMCAQVDYRDEDLQEALVNVSSGMCFCVRATAASAAGFYQTEMLNRNAKENRVGQAVVEMPDCTDLILAPEYDLEARLIALEEQENRAAPVYRNPARVNAETPVCTPVYTPVNGATSQMEALLPNPRLRLLGNAETPEVEHSEAEEASVNVNAETRKLIQRMIDMKVYKHREISKIVGLDGRKYPIYQQICREMGIATEREA